MTMMDFDLQEVFNIFDENGDGQIQLRSFVDVATNYYSDAEQLARITKALDPNNTGLINFKQFCQGIAQISSLQGLSLKEVASDLTRRSRENSLVEDPDQRSLKNTQLLDLSSLTSSLNHIQEENQDGSTVTFNEYDEPNNDVFHSHKSEKIPTVVLRTSISNTKTSNNNKTISNSNKSNRFSSPVLYGDEEEFAGVAEPESTSYSPDIVYSRPVSQRVSQIIKRNSYLQPSIPAEEVDQQLQETIDDLQKQVDTLSDQKRNTTDRLARIQNENTDLKSRLQALEDRFQDLEGQHTNNLRAEQQKYNEFINHKDRSFIEEKEILQSSVMRINAIEMELKQTQSSNKDMKKDVKDLKQKLDDVDYQLHESQLRCNNLSHDNEKLLEQLRLQRAELEAEQLTNAKLAEQLTLESSRQKFGRTLTRTESILNTYETRLRDLDEQIRILKTENEKISRENEELRERAATSALGQGGLLTANSNGPSLAAELEVLSKDELMSKLRDQYTINDRLREYIERMLTVIIDHNPQLLEVAAGSGMPINSMSMSQNNRQSTIGKIENKSSTTDKYCTL